MQQNQDQPPPFHHRDTVLLKPMSLKPQPMNYMGTVALPDGSQPLAMGSGVITTLISKGGTAIVYEIWNAELEMKRAVKLLHPDHLDESLERFETEIKITAKLRHPNIVEIYAVGKWNGLPYLEMERIQGYTLDEMLDRAGALPIEVCTSIGIMVARALYYAHNQKYMIYGKEYNGIIHRDMKPANIMVDSDGSVKLMDFGIAKPVAASGRTMEGVVFGTMQYLSPEQLQTGDVDSRSDIYSFGAVLYELLTGRKTFPDQNLAKLVTDKLNNRFKLFEEYDLKLPPALKLLVYSCLNYQKSKRIQSALALEKTLERIHSRICSRPPEEVMRQFMAHPIVRKRIVGMRKGHAGLAITLAILSLLCLSGAGVYVYLQIDKAWHQRSPVAQSDTPADQAAPETMVTAAGKTSPDASADAPGRETAQPRLPQANSNAPMIKTRQAESAYTARKITKAPANTGPSGSPATVQRKYFSVNEAAVLASNELKSGRASEALAILGAIVPGQELTREATMVKLHALQKAGDKRALANFILSQDVDDGEFCITKALYFCSTNEIAKARLFYDRSMKTSADYSDPVVVEGSRIYCKALIATAMFNANPSAETKKEALDCWFEIKLYFRSSPGHPWFKKSDAEITRINGSATNAGG